MSRLIRAVSAAQFLALWGLALIAGLVVAQAALEQVR